MGVVAHRLGERAVDAKAADETEGVRALLAVVPVEHAGLQDVVLWVCLERAVAHGHLDGELAREGVARVDAERANLARVFLRFDRDAERLRRDVDAEVHGVGHEAWPLERLDLKQRLAVLRDELAVDVDLRGAEACEVLEQGDVRALARRDGAHVQPDAEVRGRVDGAHLDGDDGVEPEPDGLAQDAVHVAVRDDGVRVRVVRAQHAVAGVHAALHELRQVARQVEPGRALAQLHVHTHAELCEDVLERAGLVAARDAGGDVGVQAAVVVRRDVVAGHGLVGLEGLLHLAERVLLARKDAGEVHHLAKAAGLGPRHGVRHLRGVDAGARVLHAQDRRHARRRGEHDLERRAGGVLPHGLDALEAADVCDLVRVRVDADGAVGHDAARVLGRADHAGLDVDVGVQKAGRGVEAVGVHDGGVGADAVLGRVAVEPDVGDAPAADGDVRVLQDLARGDADEPRVADDRVCGPLSLRHANELAVAFPEGNLAEVVDHARLP